MAGPTIGFMTNQLHGNHQSMIGRACMKSLVSSGLGSVWFPGSPLNSPLEFEKQQNVIYQLLRQGRSSGILASSGVLSGHVSKEEYELFLKHMPAVPCVSVSLPIPGLQSVVCDDRKGVFEGVAHLVRIHGCKRIAVLKGIDGHWEAELRYAGFCDALRENGLQVIPELVFRGHFKVPEAKDAIGRFIDSGIELFDAIVCGNDEMALGAYQVLTERGIRVPEQVKIIGYDDIKEAYINPVPLTSVKVPFSQLMDTAVSILGNEIKNPKTQAETTVLPTTLVVRRSCGCFDPMMEISFGLLPNDEWSAFPSAIREMLYEFLPRFISNPSKKNLEGFLQDWERCLSAELETDQEFSSIIGLLSNTKSRMDQNLVSAHNSRRYDQLFFEIISLTVGLSHRIRTRRAREEDLVREQLQLSLQAILSSNDRKSLISTICEELPLIGLSNFYLSLYEKEYRLRDARRLDTLPDAHLLLAVEHGVPLAIRDEITFPSGDIIPRDIFDIWGAHGRHFIVLPLFFKTEHFGFMAVEFLAGPETIYETLRMAISTTLKNCFVNESQQNAKYLALQSQINPHFLFNTLSLISIAGREAKSTATEQIVSRLSSMLRYTTDFGTNLASLPEEIGYAKDYLELMEMRYYGRFNFSVKLSVHEQVSTLVPKLILQPLVENCFQHGFLSVKPPWFIEVIVHSDNAGWSLSVSDNGAGMSPEKRETLLEKVRDLHSPDTFFFNGLSLGGLAILNICHRLKLRYGDLFRLSLEPSKISETGLTVGIRVANPQ